MKNLIWSCEWWIFDLNHCPDLQTNTGEVICIRSRRTICEPRDSKYCARPVVVREQIFACFCVQLEWKTRDGACGELSLSFDEPCQSAYTCYNKVASDKKINRWCVIWSPITGPCCICKFILLWIKKKKKNRTYRDLSIVKLRISFVKRCKYFIFFFIFFILCIFTLKFTIRQKTRFCLKICLHFNSN